MPDLPLPAAGVLSTASFEVICKLGTRLCAIVAKDLLDGKAFAIVLLQVILSIYQQLSQDGRD
jgi:hypothetical protein